MCGCTITARIAPGTGICLTRGWSMPTVSTSPPYSDGAMLSTCIEPLATASPCIAYCSSSSCVRGCGSSALAATTAATAEAAEPPSPEASGMPLSISSSKPKSSGWAVVQRDDRASGGVLRRLERQILHHAANRLDGHAGRRGAPRRHAIADAHRPRSRGYRIRWRRCRPRPARYAVATVRARALALRLTAVLRDRSSGAADRRTRRRR